jgi:alpha-tubulin suppressor-like RCC1 family protein
VAGGNTWKQSSSGTNHTAAIKTDGTLWLWGAAGSLGDNTAVGRSSPVQTVAGGTNWSQVSVGGFSAAIKTDGTLWCWGTGTSGQLGDNTIVSKSSPVQTVVMGTNWLQVSAGSVNIAAIKTDGTLWVWGANSGGNLGDNTVNSKSSPVQTIAGGTNWKQVSVSNIGSGTFAGVKTDGTLWLWGANSSGQLGDNSITSRSSPVQTIAGGTNWKQVSAGILQTIATKTDGTLWAWGSNSAGNLGDNTITSRSSPVQVIGNAVDWLSVSSGGTGYNMAIKSS